MKDQIIKKPTFHFNLDKGSFTIEDIKTGHKLTHYEREGLLIAAMIPDGRQGVLTDVDSEKPTVFEITLTDNTKVTIPFHELKLRQLDLNNKED